MHKYHKMMKTACVYPSRGCSGPSMLSDDDGRSTFDVKRSCGISKFAGAEAELFGSSGPEDDQIDGRSELHGGVQLDGRSDDGSPNFDADGCIPRGGVQQSGGVMPTREPAPLSSEVEMLGGNLLRSPWSWTRATAQLN